MIFDYILINIFFFLKNYAQSFYTDHLQSYNQPQNHPPIFPEYGTLEI
jgi:hypothetical protein